MPTFTSENRDSWQSLADSVAPQRPSVGKRVKVIGGKKHLNKEGVVTWHGRDKYTHAFRYGDTAQHTIIHMRGRYGYRVRIQTETESFFIGADSVEVLF